MFGGFRNNAYLCTAKMLMRYEEGRRCAAVFVSAILFINRPIGAAASGIRKDQVAIASAAIATRTLSHILFIRI